MDEKKDLQSDKNVGSASESETLNPSIRNRRTSVAESKSSPVVSSPANANRNVQKKNRKPRKEHKVFRRFGIFVFSLMLIGLISVSSIGLYVLKHMSDFVNGQVAIDLDEYKEHQSQTTILFAYDSYGNEVELARLHGEENRIWVDLDEMPKNLQNAFIALEDVRFRKHSGVDWRRTISVMVLPQNDGQGGSTITQQLIKNLTGAREVTYIRKFNEIKNALNLEKHYSKETIFEAYLNTLYLDAGCYGVQTASEYYFGKNVSELNLAECACIAAITQAPRANNPILNPEENKTRSDYCLKVMLSEGYITQEEYDEAIAYDLVFTTDDDYVPSEDAEGAENNQETEAPEEEEAVQSYYVDYVIEKVIEDLMDTHAYSYNDAWRKVYYGGLKIHVAVDLDIQQEIENIYYNRRGFPKAKNSYGEDVQSCMVIMDYTGRVLGLVGQAGEKLSARCLNIATDSRRQPGSSIKPLSVYSLAIDSNLYTWSNPMVQNYGILVDGKRWPMNYGGNPGSPSSYKTLQKALAPSDNTVPAQMVKHMGIDRCYEWLQDTFKFTSLEEEDRTYSSLAVGGMNYGVYALEMCAAYTTFGTGGVYYEPYCYYTVTNSTGSQVYLTHNDSGEQVMERSSAEVMNKMLQTVVTESNGTGRNYKVSGFEMFAKTGTTSDEKDRWFIGGTPYYVCTVWMGYAEHSEPLDFSTNYCGELYQTVMNKIHQNLPSKSFEFSDDIVRRSYCIYTGRIAGSRCSATATGWYKADSLPPTCTNCSAGPGGIGDAVVDPNATTTDPNATTSPSNTETTTSSQVNPTNPPTPPTTTPPVPTTVPQISATLPPMVNNEPAGE